MQLPPDLPSPPKEQVLPPVKKWFPKIYLIIIAAMVLLGLAGYFYLQNTAKKPTPVNIKQATPSAIPAIDAPISSSFSAVVKEVKNGVLVVVETEENKEIIEIPLDGNIQVVALIPNNKNPNNLPDFIPADTHSLKAGQRLEIRKTQFGQKTLYELTIR